MAFPFVSLARHEVQAGLALALLTVWTFAPVCGCPFVNFDDPIYVKDNLPVQAGLSLEGIGWSFTTFQASNWHPLTWMSLQLDEELFGNDPAALHRTNLILPRLPGTASRPSGSTCRGR